MRYKNKRKTLQPYGFIFYSIYIYYMVDIKEFIDSIQSKYADKFGNYRISCEKFYDTTRFSNNKHVDFSKEMEAHKRQYKCIVCLERSYYGIGFWDLNDRFIPLFFASATKKIGNYPEFSVSPFYTFFSGREFKSLKKIFFQILYLEVLKLKQNNEVLICSGVHPDLRPSVKELYEVEVNGKRMFLESYSNLTPPFSVLSKTHKFEYPEYNSDFTYVVNYDNILNPIAQRHKFINNQIKKYEVS